MAKFKFFSVGGESDTDTNTNIANDNLIATATTRTYQLASSGKLTFQTNAGNDILRVDDAAGDITIGNSTTYTLPTARAGASDRFLVSTNATTGTAWGTAVADKGGMFQCFSGSISSLSSLRNAVFKKNGGAMHTPNNLTSLSLANCITYEAAISQGTRSLSSMQVYFSATETGEDNSITITLLRVAGDTETAFTFTSQNLATNVFCDDANTIKRYEFTDLDVVVPDDQLYVLGLLSANAEAAITTIYCWITLYYDTTIEKA